MDLIIIIIFYIIFKFKLKTLKNIFHDLSLYEAQMLLDKWKLTNGQYYANRDPLLDKCIISRATSDSKTNDDTKILVIKKQYILLIDAKFIYIEKNWK